MQLAVIAGIFIAIAGVLFAMQNNVPVSVNFLIWRFESSLALVLTLAVACGAIVIALLTTPATLRNQWVLSRQKRRIDELERKDNELRGRIADLERQMHVVSPLPEQPPYVGLRQIVSDVGKKPEGPGVSGPTGRRPRLSTRGSGRAMRTEDASGAAAGCHSCRVARSRASSSRSAGCRRPKQPESTMSSARATQACGCPAPPDFDL